ncbi:response regulator transcription factor [Bacillus taeanensis]|uniref:DNA-binding response regulator n=1 Tax=Bacillus taeanensis TaxID=273032 RepID=A0A366XTL6_9BACI|nr:response regulator transcription factor [Bacillus taeanensis]RBW67494.1 DNA-binding response regulator [Bacillus taeanensis]
MDKAIVLIVDDEWNMRNLIRVYLVNNQFNVLEAKSGIEALEITNKQHVDLIILDIMMPDMDGWEVCRKVRKIGNTPILMLTARTDIKDRVHGLNIGADDYLTKPFAPEELIARAHALLRRMYTSIEEENHSELLVFKDLSIDNKGKQVYVKNQLIEFTPKEYDLLYLLAVNAKRVYSRDMLLSQVWEYDSYRDERTVDTHVKNIREKLRKAGLSFNSIKTVWGVGYKFQFTDDHS